MQLSCTFQEMDWPFLYVAPVLIVIALYCGAEQWVPNQRPQQPSLTVILSNYCSGLIAGSICVTLKDFLIVRIGQDHLWGSLYAIECSFDRPCSRVRLPLWFLLFWLLWSDHNPWLRWEWRAIIPSCPAVTLVLCYVMEVSCYHSLWAVKLQILPAPCYSGLYHH